jgi:hypothetical protein
MEYPTEIITPELKIELIGENFRYFHITFPNTSRERIDVWADYVEKVIVNTPQDGFYCNIFDISEANISLTPYLRAKGAHLYRIIGKRDALVGFVVKNSVFTQFIAFFARGFDTNNIKTTLFYNREEAIKWGATRLSKLSKGNV